MIENKNYQVSRIAWDGGPCSGKTTGMSIATQKLTGLGVIPLVVPESATLLIQNGIKPEMIGYQKFQELVLELQVNNEKIWRNSAQTLANRHKKRVVIMCDRGLLSGAAYLSGDRPLVEYEKLLRKHKLDVEKARSMYEGIILLRTAADGVPEFYTTANNSARSESAEEAVALCDRTQNLCWNGHSHVASIRNIHDGRPVSFEEKIDRSVEELFRFLGLPAPLEIEDKYKLVSFDPRSIPVPFEKIEIEQTYLLSEHDKEIRVRSRTWMDSSSYFYNVKTPTEDLIGRLEFEYPISEREYLKHLRARDLNYQVISKTRHCFLWESQYFELDVFHGRHEGLVLLERERRREDTTKLPELLNVEEDVTMVANYKNKYLAGIH